MLGENPENRTSVLQRIRLRFKRKKKKKKNHVLIDRLEVAGDLHKQPDTDELPMRVLVCHGELVREGISEPGCKYSH